MRRMLLATSLMALLANSDCEAQDKAHTAPRSFGHLFSLVGDFPLGERTGRVDYESVDPAARRLYIAKMGAGELLAFDLGQNKIVASLKGFPKITGVLAVPELHKLYASVPGAGLVSSVLVGLGMVGLSSGHGAVAVLDTTNMREIARLPGGVFPDGIAYDPKDRKIFISDEFGSAVQVIDASTNKVIARIDAGGEVGNVRYDPATEKIYVPVQSRNALAVIDPVKTKLIAHHPLPGGEHPHGLAIAPGAAVGFVACDGNDMLLTVDLKTGKVLDRKKLGHDPDVLAIDAERKRLYVASESGNLSSFDIMAAAAPIALGDVFVAEEAHSVAVDPASHLLYFPLANFDGRAVLRVLAPNPPP